MRRRDLRRPLGALSIYADVSAEAGAGTRQACDRAWQGLGGDALQYNR